MKIISISKAPQAMGFYLFRARFQLCSLIYFKYTVFKLCLT